MMDEKSEEIEMLPTITATAGGPLQEPTDEGDGHKTTNKRTPAMELRDDSASEHDSEEDDAMTKFLDGDRPTSAGEPSHNVPRKVEISPWSISTVILLLSLSVFILITMFAPQLFENAIQNMLHFMVDENSHNSGRGPNILMLFFCIFNTSIFAMCGNIDYLLMLSCGYLYADEAHQWLTGAAVYIICNYIGCCVTFVIGRTLFKDKLYSIFSKHEKYRYFQRAFTDYSLLLSTALNLNPFLPSGLIVYCLSISSMSWTVFLIGQASRIPNAAIMCYAGYFIRRYTRNDAIENTNIERINIHAYKTNSYTYSFTITFCVVFAVLLLFTLFAMYLQFQRLVLGDVLRKAQESSETDTSNTSSRSSVSDSNEDIDDDSVSYSSSESSGNTLDEYGFPNEKHETNETFLFQDDYDPTIADHSDSEHSNAGEVEMQENETEKAIKKRRKRKKSKHRLQTDPEKKKKKKKKKKKRKLNNKIWQTIVLATSPTEDNSSMLFEEGLKKNGEQQNYFGRQQEAGSIVIDVNANNNRKNTNDRKSSKSAKAKSPRSPKAVFGKMFAKNENDDAQTPRSGKRG